MVETLNHWRVCVFVCVHVCVYLCVCVCACVRGSVCTVSHRACLKVKKVSRCVSMCVSSISALISPFESPSHCRRLSDEGVSRQNPPAKWNETDLDVSYERKPHHTYDSESTQQIRTESPISAVELIFNLV